MFGFWIRRRAMDNERVREPSEEVQAIVEQYVDAIEAEDTLHFDLRLTSDDRDWLAALRIGDGIGIRIGKEGK
jgi:hypothetical protein